MSSKGRRKFLRRHYKSGVKRGSRRAQHLPRTVKDREARSHPKPPVEKNKITMTEVKSSDCAVLEHELDESKSDVWSKETSFEENHKCAHVISSDSEESIDFQLLTHVGMGNLKPPETVTKKLMRKKKLRSQVRELNHVDNSLVADLRRMRSKISSDSMARKSHVSEMEDRLLNLQNEDTVQNLYEHSEDHVAKKESGGLLQKGSEESRIILTHENDRMPSALKPPLQKPRHISKGCQLVTSSFPRRRLHRPRTALKKSTSKQKAKTSLKCILNCRQSGKEETLIETPSREARRISLDGDLLVVKSEPTLPRGINVWAQWQNMSENPCKCDSSSDASHGESFFRCVGRPKVSAVVMTAKTPSSNERKCCDTPSKSEQKACEVVCTFHIDEDSNIVFDTEAPTWGSSRQVELDLSSSSQDESPELRENSQAPDVKEEAPVPKTDSLLSSLEKVVIFQCIRKFVSGVDAFISPCHLLLNQYRQPFEGIDCDSISDDLEGLIHHAHDLVGLMVQTIHLLDEKQILLMSDEEIQHVWLLHDIICCVLQAMRYLDSINSQGMDGSQCKSLVMLSCQTLVPKKGQNVDNWVRSMSKISAVQDLMLKSHMLEGICKCKELFHHDARQRMCAHCGVNDLLNTLCDGDTNLPSSCSSKHVSVSQAPSFTQLLPTLNQFLTLVSDLETNTLENIIAYHELQKPNCHPDAGLFPCNQHRSVTACTCFEERSPDSVLRKDSTTCDGDLDSKVATVNVVQAGSLLPKNSKLVSRCDVQTQVNAFPSSDNMNEPDVVLFSQPVPDGRTCCSHLTESTTLQRMQDGSESEKLSHTVDADSGKKLIADRVNETEPSVTSAHDENNNHPEEMNEEEFSLRVSDSDSSKGPSHSSDACSESLSSLIPNSHQDEEKFKAYSNHKQNRSLVGCSLVNNSNSPRLAGLKLRSAEEDGSYMSDQDIFGSCDPQIGSDLTRDAIEVSKNHHSVSLESFPKADKKAGTGHHLSEGEDVERELEWIFLPSPSSKTAKASCQASQRMENGNSQRPLEGKGAQLLDEYNIRKSAPSKSLVSEDWEHKYDWIFFSSPSSETSKASCRSSQPVENGNSQRPLEGKGAQLLDSCNIRNSSPSKSLLDACRSDSSSSDLTVVLTDSDSEVHVLTSEEEVPLKISLSEGQPVSETNHPVLRIMDKGTENERSVLEATELIPKDLEQVCKIVPDASEVTVRDIKVANKDVKCPLQSDKSVQQRNRRSQAFESLNSNIRLNRLSLRRSIKSTAVTEPPSVSAKDNPECQYKSESKCSDEKEISPNSSDDASRKSKEENTPVQSEQLRTNEELSGITETHNSDNGNKKTERRVQNIQEKSVDEKSSIAGCETQKPRECQEIFTQSGHTETNIDSAKGIDTDAPIPQSQGEKKEKMNHTETSHVQVVTSMFSQGSVLGDDTEQPITERKFPENHRAADKNSGIPTLAMVIPEDSPTPFHQKNKAKKNVRFSGKLEYATDCDGYLKRCYPTIIKSLDDSLNVDDKEGYIEANTLIKRSQGIPVTLKHSDLHCEERLHSYEEWATKNPEMIEVKGIIKEEEARSAKSLAKIPECISERSGQVEKRKKVKRRHNEVHVLSGESVVNELWKNSWEAQHHGYPKRSKKLSQLVVQSAFDIDIPSQCEYKLEAAVNDNDPHPFRHEEQDVSSKDNSEGTKTKCKQSDGFVLQVGENTSEPDGRKQKKRRSHSKVSGEQHNGYEETSPTILDVIGRNFSQGVPGEKPSEMAPKDNLRVKKLEKTTPTVKPSEFDFIATEHTQEKSCTTAAEFMCDVVPEVSLKKSKKRRMTEEPNSEPVIIQKISEGRREVDDIISKQSKENLETEETSTKKLWKRKSDFSIPCETIETVNSSEGVKKRKKRESESWTASEDAKTTVVNEEVVFLSTRIQEKLEEHQCTIHDVLDNFVSQDRFKIKEPLLRSAAEMKKENDTNEILKLVLSELLMAIDGKCNPGSSVNLNTSQSLHEHQTTEKQVEKVDPALRKSGKPGPRFSKKKKQKKEEINLDKLDDQEWRAYCENIKKKILFERGQEL